MRVLVLAMDAFGGHGGMAQFNRHFLRALCAHSACSEVVAVPRVVSHPVEALPAKLTYRDLIDRPVLVQPCSFRWTRAIMAKLLGDPQKSSPSGSEYL